MDLKIIRQRTWTIYEVCDDEGNSPLLEWCSSLNKNYQGSVKRLFTIIDQVASDQNGPTRLPDDISHEANKNDSIFEFIAGDLRLFWFYSTRERKVIICGGYDIKKSKKANKREVDRVIKYKKQYEKAYQQRKITYHQDKEGGK